MYDGFLTYQVVLDTRRMSNPSSPNQGTFSSAKGGHLEVFKRGPAPSGREKLGSTTKRNWNLNMEPENKLPLEKGSTTFGKSWSFWMGSMLNFKGVILFLKGHPHFIQETTSASFGGSGMPHWALPVLESLVVQLPNQPQQGPQRWRGVVGWKAGPLPGTNEQWKKGPWLFRVCKGWHPTQLFGDYNKPW